ncbi:tail fiber assembly protein [Cedecea sp. P7760]|uniref:tail fiber assembly protein n=1 Tax=Cedecea sp. P7760 TaxID=2726983 RepID=UPI0015A2F35E|nr:tail fiber assembly protein [Cedecea sp. P7760]NWC62911.1 tail fiber assembly protein [Cedecea sp. P7760]
MYAYAKNNFYPFDLRESYEAAGTWPESFVEVEDEVFGMYSGLPSEGKMRGADAEGKPAWVDIPAPTAEEIIAAAERKKKALLSEADSITADWRTELALSIIDEDDKAKLTAWMKYIKAVKTVDTSTAPDVSWPEKPGA